MCVRAQQTRQMYAHINSLRLWTDTLLHSGQRLLWENGFSHR